MTTPDIKYPALIKAGRVLTSDQSRSILLTGTIDDLYYDAQANGGKGDYVPLIDKLSRVWSGPQWVVVTYQLNGPIRFQNEVDKAKMLNAWARYRCADIDPGHSSSWLDPEKVGRAEAAKTQLLEALTKAQESPSMAFELLRQMCISSREAKGVDGKLAMPENLRIIVEGADMHLPETEVSRMTDGVIRRIGICHDWFSDPAFQRGGDVVVLLAETRGAVNNRISRLPQIIGVELPAPDEGQRRHCIDWFNATQVPVDRKVSMRGKDLALWTAGLTIHALVQLLRGAVHEGGVIEPDAVIEKVEAFIKAQLGDDVVDFKRPHHRLKDLVGNTKLIRYLNDTLIPRFKSTGPDALTGAAVGGPLGVGKTYIFEAVAAELDMPVLVIKGIRSQWFGQTDVIIERLRRVLVSLSKALIFVDEADTQFADVAGEPHSTERRVTGAMLQMMSDPRTKGKILWLLMSARVHLLPPDMKRPGRVGDLIIPVLDPEGDDRTAFLEWAVKPVLPKLAPTTVVVTDGSKAFDPPPRRDLAAVLPDLAKLATKYSAASYTLLRSELIAAAKGGTLSTERIMQVAEDLIPPTIEDTRRLQTLYALVNCTRRSLLPDIGDGDIDAVRAKWNQEIQDLEARGIR